MLWRLLKALMDWTEPGLLSYPIPTLPTRLPVYLQLPQKGPRTLWAAGKTILLLGLHTPLSRSQSGATGIDPTSTHEFWEDTIQSLIGSEGRIHL